MATREPQPSGVLELDEGPLEDVIASNDVVLAEFVTEWCGACRRMEPVLDAIAADTDATVVTVDVESHLETAVEHGAQSTPTFVCFADGRPATRVRGAQTEAALRDLLDTYLE